MADVAARRLAGEDVRFAGADLSAKLKLLGVDVASFGDYFADLERPDQTRALVFEDRTEGVYQKLLFDPERERLLGGILVGDASAYVQLSSHAVSGAPVPAHPRELLFGAPGAPRSRKHGEPARRGADLLVQQRHQGRSRAVDRGWRPHDGRGREEVHPGRDRLRRVPAGRGFDPRGRAREERSRAGASPVRTLPLHAPGAVLDRQARPDRELRRAARRPWARGRLRGVPARGGVDPRRHLERSRLRARGDPGHQRPLPRQHPARRHVLGDPADSGRRDHAREADRARRGRGEVRPLLQDHRRPAHRSARCARRSAPGDLGGPRGRGLRERPRLRQGDAHGEELHRVDLVPLWRAGLDRSRDPDRGALPRHPRSAQAQVGRLGLHPRMRRGAEQGLRRHCDREGLERLPVRQWGEPSAARRPVRDGCFAKTR